MPVRLYVSKSHSVKMENDLLSAQGLCLDNLKPLYLDFFRMLKFKHAINIRELFLAKKMKIVKRKE